MLSWLLLNYETRWADQEMLVPVPRLFIQPDLCNTSQAGMHILAAILDEGGPIINQPDTKQQKL